MPPWVPIGSRRSMRDAVLGFALELNHRPPQGIARLRHKKGSFAIADKGAFSVTTNWRLVLAFLLGLRPDRNYWQPQPVVAAGAAQPQPAAGAAQPVLTGT